MVLMKSVDLSEEGIQMGSRVFNVSMLVIHARRRNMAMRWENGSPERKIEAFIGAGGWGGLAKGRPSPQKQEA